MNPISRRDPRFVAFVALLVAAAVIAVGLAFFGVGAELSEDRTVVVRVRIVDLNKEVAAQIVEDETVFADPGGMAIGRIVGVDVGPVERAVATAEGVLVPADDPVQQQAIIEIEAAGREGNGIVALHNQVVQAGQVFNVVTKDMFLRGTVLSVDVR